MAFQSLSINRRQFDSNRGTKPVILPLWDGRPSPLKFICLQSDSDRSANNRSSTIKMLIANLELNHQAKLPAGHTLAAFFQEIGTWQKLLARLHTHRSELPIEFEQFENADETIHEEFAHSDPGNSLVFRLLPGVRCSA